MRYNLSEITEVIRQRRSIAPEHYTDREIHPEIIKNILNNALWAPTHGMNQPWHFKIYREGGLDLLAQKIPELYRNETPKDKYSAAKEEKFRKRFETISAAILICMKRKEGERIPEVEDIEAVACSVQNMMLTCTAYGIGSFWSSPAFIYSQAMKDFLGLEEHDRCLGLFYLGYPGIDWPDSHRRPLEYHAEWIES